MNRIILATGLATALVVAVTGGSFGRETTKDRTGAQVAPIATTGATTATPSLGATTANTPSLGMTTANAPSGCR